MQDKLNKPTIHQAFITEETTRRRRAADQLAMAALTQRTSCEFCGKTGHVMAKCYAFQDAQKEATKKAAANKQSSNNKSRQRKRSETANKAQESKDTPKDEESTTEFAGNASTHLPDHSDLSSPLQLDADFDWIPDSGATSHMTPHRHWIRNYTPFRVPIKLADNSIIYSAGVGTVVFNPVVKGKNL